MESPLVLVKLVLVSFHGVERGDAPFLILF